MSEKYINQICRRLKCSGKKRKEIKIQLMSDIGAALENGESTSQIKKRMGAPSEAAQEFNRNFSEDEKRRYKKEKLIKWLIIVIAALVFLSGVLYWIWPKTLSAGGMDEDLAVDEARTVIRLLDAGDYEALRSKAIDPVAELMTEAVIDPEKQKICPEWGAFVSYGNAYVGRYSQMGQELWVVQMNVSYENIGITYTISFDQDMKLAGLYMK